MGKVFLSYASSDLKKVSKLHDALEAKGYNAWFDQELKSKSKDINSQINEKLNWADTVIVCWSSVSVERKYVKAEAQHALDDKKYIGLKIGKCKVPVPFNTEMNMSFIGWNGEDDSEDFQALVQKL